LALTAVAGLESRGPPDRGCSTHADCSRKAALGEKTVEKHLSQVSGKLGISGRAAIGAKLADA
jgi:DNA-binding NarL/FixJ family response regulator